MKALKKLTPVALATTMAIGGMVAAPMTAQAGVTATIQAANMYLWRGENLTQDGAQVSGDLNYSHDSGFYVGAWTTTETGGMENDIYVGFGGEVAGFSYDISYWKYLYPENINTDLTPNSGSLSDTDNSEVAVSLGYGPVTATAYINVESDTTDDDYFTVALSYDKYSLTYGWWDLETAGANERTNISLMYAATDELTLGVSVLNNDSGYTEESADGFAEDPLFYVSYSKSFDL